MLFEPFILMRKFPSKCSAESLLRLLDLVWKKMLKPLSASFEDIGVTNILRIIFLSSVDISRWGELMSHRKLWLFRVCIFRRSHHD